MRILVADDDALIRRWIAILIGQIPDYAITVDVVENGVQALQYIRGGTIPDLLITDIKMPQMDGLTLCQHLKEEFPQIKVVILSAYEEFPLAKKALQLGAMDYILKVDLCLEDLCRIIEKAEDARSQKHPPNSHHATEERRFLLNDYLNSGRHDDSYFLLHLDPQLSLDTLSLVMLHFDTPPDRPAELSELENFPGHGIFVAYDDTIYLAFVCGHSSGSMEERRDCVNEFLRRIQERGEVSVDAWATLLDCRDMGISSGIQNCKAVLQFKYYYSLKTLETVGYREAGSIEPCSRIAVYRDVSQASRRYQVQDVASILRGYLQTLHSAYYHPLDIQHNMSVICHKLLFDISVLEKSGDWFSQLLQRIHEIESANTRSLRESALEQFLKQINTVFSEIFPKHSGAVSKIITYINEHFNDKITLEIIAEHLHMNSSYVSDLFKREMGFTLNDYTNKLRLGHACEYLRFSELTIGEVAEACGFSDQNYFTKVFKKYLEMTPSQYRTNMTDTNI